MPADCPGRRSTEKPMRTTRFGSCCLLAALGWVLVAGGASAGEWKPAADGSSVTLHTIKQGASFSGVFDEFTATIDFDESAPEAGRIVGNVRTDSYRTADPQNDTYVRGYLDVEQFPEARFESARIETTPEGYLASGELTIKGITKPATLLFIFTTTSESGPAAARFQGLMTINRFDFDVAADVDTSWAGRDVTVAIDLHLEP